MIRRIMRGAVAAVLTSTGVVALASTPASAAACQRGEGVSVVLGSNVTCVAHTGGNAAGNFSAADIELEQVQRQPGMICKVNGLPADAGCVNSPPANAYWGLFWSDGTSGVWKYSTLGVNGLTVPRGGWVAFVFQNSNSRTQPGVKPVAAPAQGTPTRPTAKPKSDPAPKATKEASKQPAKPKATAAPAPLATAARPTETATPTPSAATATPEGKKTKATATPSAAPSAGAPMSVDDQAAQAQMVDASKDDDGSGTLGWVAGGAVALLLVAGMGTTAWRRRSDGGHP